MTKEPIKFSDYKLVIPNMRKFIKKMEQFVSELKACNNADEASKIIKKLNKFNSEMMKLAKSLKSSTNSIVKLKHKHLLFMSYILAIQPIQNTLKHKNI